MRHTSKFSDRILIKQEPNGVYSIEVISCMCNGNVTSTFLTRDVKYFPLSHPNGFEFETITKRGLQAVIRELVS